MARHQRINAEYMRCPGCGANCIADEPCEACRQRRMSRHLRRLEDLQEVVREAMRDVSRIAVMAKKGSLYSEMIDGLIELGRDLERGLSDSEVS